MPLQLLSTLSGHTDRVWCCAWSPNGRALATCGGDKQIRIWTRNSKESTQTDTGTTGSSHQQQQQFTCKQVMDGTHSRTIRWVSWSPNGKYLASAGFDGITAIWENQDGEFECVATLEGHENEVKCVSWSRNGQLLATCSRDKSVWIWTAEGNGDTGEKEFECLSVLNGHTQDVKVAKWHPKIDSMLISASYDNTIKVWTEEDDDWYATETLNGHTSTVWSLSFSPDASQLASCSDDKSILIWERSDKASVNTTDGTTTTSNTTPGSWKLKGALNGYHERCIYTIDWSKSGLLSSGSADDSICIFGPPSAATSASSSSTAASTPSDATASKSASTAAGNSTTTAASPTNTLTPLTTPPPDMTLLYQQKSAHSGDVNCVQWNPVETDLLASAGDDGTIKIWQWTK